MTDGDSYDRRTVIRRGIGGTLALGFGGGILGAVRNKRLESAEATVGTCNRGTGEAVENREQLGEPTLRPIPSPYGTGDNHWLAFARARSTTGFTRYQSTFTVPDEPAEYGPNVVFFYFPAFQSYGEGTVEDDYIIQPVVTWNWAGSYRWKMAVWYGSAQRGFDHSQLVEVSPGDELYAVMQAPEELPGEWYLKVFNRDTGQFSGAYSHTLDRKFRYAFLALEANGAYRHGEGQALPGGCTFDQILIRDHDGRRWRPSWNFDYDPYLKCGLSISRLGTKVTFETV